ncbi:lipoprotein [Gilvimarinus sp. SDUM040013]|uniref:Lipoprotein n=1 Tax=Gilvimarinus gilvus TaxID=3058038 RepID=A0ABU4S3I4_9GAMM|nr:lipoprotein [Gilvimarinus sp. SDUM040013]MDO3384440.1 lipoprotein [Gilvimarinus sp. SDUM040013]MDX6851091.1 lipoprotein [Gilvimarinus sp. SDUM040013]
MVRIAFLLSLLLGSLLTGCGQTGPLYLPSDDPAATEQDSADK